MHFSGVHDQRRVHDSPVAKSVYCTHTHTHDLCLERPRIKILNVHVNTRDFLQVATGTRSNKTTCL